MIGINPSIGSNHELKETIRVKQIIDEDFYNYKKPSMLISTCFCDWKCCNDLGVSSSVCHNSELSKSEIVEVNIEDLIKRYMDNSISQAIVIGGLEPFLQIDEICSLLFLLRHSGCTDDFIIYTGYTEAEVLYQIRILYNLNCDILSGDSMGNIIIKFGRYIPNHEPHYDDVLGVDLASNNQYAVNLLTRAELIPNFIKYKGYSSEEFKKEYECQWVTRDP